MIDEERAIVEPMQPLLKVTEVSRLLNVHPNTIRRWSDRGLIQSYRINMRGDRRFRPDQVTRFLSDVKTLGMDTQSTERVPG